jgi:hypothetical protein
MLFTKAAKVVAGLGFVLGLLTFLVGVAAVTGIGDPEISKRAGVSGKTLDFGLYWMVGAIALGVLAEISQSLADIARGREQ